LKIEIVVNMCDDVILLPWGRFRFTNYIRKKK